MLYDDHVKKETLRLHEQLTRKHINEKDAPQVFAQQNQSIKSNQERTVIRPITVGDNSKAKVLEVDGFHDVNCCIGWVSPERLVVEHLQYLSPSTSFIALRDRLDGNVSIFPSISFAVRMEV